jgi:1-acyl-sn-glycerol-3-phosphate acyltransferase
MIRGWLALAFASLALAIGDVVQRLVVAPWVQLQPSRRIPVLGGWIKIMAWITTKPVAWIGGCVIPMPPRLVPTRPGVLVVMNHQSLLDIPLVVQTVSGDGYPRIVTRDRYARWIPLISHMVRLYQYPVVDPGAKSDQLRRSLDEIGAVARESDVPLCVFPEGSRSRDGEIGRFKRGALASILGARPWTVYVYVADGFWKVGRYWDFVRHVGGIRGKVEHAGVLEWTDPTADPDPFIDTIRETMVRCLEMMRREEEAA